MAINKKNLNQNEIQQIINDYKNGKSMRQIEKEYGVTRQSVAIFLEKNKIKTTKGNHFRKYTHDYSFFKDIDSEEKAYWLGFMFADGYIVDKTRGYGEDCFGITLHAKDIKTLQDFKKSINATNPITDVSRDGRDLRRIILTSQQTVDDLISHGCVKQKSLILKPPISVPKNLIHHFIRGFFDGDGSIFWNKTAFKKHDTWTAPSYSICITSTKEMIEWIIENTGVGILKKENRREKTWYLSQSGNNKVRTFCDFIYKDATIFMDRKYKLYKDLVKYQETKGRNV